MASGLGRSGSKDLRYLDNHRHNSYVLLGVDMGTRILARRAAIAFLYHIPETYEPTAMGQTISNETQTTLTFQDGNTILPAPRPRVHFTAPPPAIFFSPYSSLSSFAPLALCSQPFNALEWTTPTMATSI